MAASSTKRKSEKSTGLRDLSLELARRDIKEQIASLRASIKKAIDDCDNTVRDVIKKAAR